MPGIIEFNAVDKAQREMSDKEFAARRRIIRMNRDYYNGIMRKPLANDRDNVIINLVRPAVDRTIAFLLPDMPELQLDELNNTADEDALAALWKAWGEVRALQNMAINGALSGHVFARVMPGDDPTAPRLLTVNPANIITWWDADDVERPLAYEIRWSSGGTDQRQDIVLAEAKRWTISDYSRDRGGQWRPVMEPMIWPYPFPPIIDWQHLPEPHAYYGQPEITGDHIRLNDALNRAASDQAAILRHHAAPLVFGSGGGMSRAAVDQLAIGSYIGTDDAAASLRLIEMQGDLAASQQAMQFYMQRFFVLSRVVMPSADLDAFSGMTNLAVRATFMDMIAKNKTLRGQYGAGIQQISRAALALQGIEQLPSIEWPSALPIDDAARMTKAQQLRALGVSEETVLRALGYDYDLERSRRTREALDAAILIDGAPVGTSG